MSYIIDPEEMIQQEIKNRFDVKLYSNLSIPSFSHAYSVGVEYAKNWFLRQFNSNYFKKESIFINEKYITDDYRRLKRSDILKKDKPLLIITPEPTPDFDLDNVHMYNYGPNMIAMNSSWINDSFFRDVNKGLYLLMNMKLMEMRCTYKVQVYTRSQQLDLFEKMKILFRIGATQSEDIDMDFHIPMDIMINIANDAGFEIDDNKNIINPIEFVRYLNEHSAYPILYKLRGGTGNKEFFMRIPRLCVHTNCTDRLDRDDGNRLGMLNTDYNINMSVVFRMPVPAFYAYYTKDPIKYTFERIEMANIRGEKIKYRFDILTIKKEDIPSENEKGWQKMVWTEYETDDGEDHIDLTELFGTSEFAKVINYTKNLNISPSSYMEVRLYTNDPYEDGTIPIKMNWTTNTIEFDHPIDSQALYISIYVDMGYYNDTISELNRADKTRFN